MCPADGLHRGQRPFLVVQLLAQPFALDKQDRAGILRQAGRDGAGRHAVHHLQRHRHDPLSDDRGDRLRGRHHAVECRQHGRHTLGAHEQADGDLGDDGQGAFGADQQPHQIVAGAVGRGATDAHDLTTGNQHRFQCQHVIRGDTVCQAMGATGVLRDVAANRAGWLAGGIGGIVQPVRRYPVRQFGVDHPRLDDCDSISQVHAPDAVEARGGQNYATLNGHRAPR